MTFWTRLAHIIDRGIFGHDPAETQKHLTEERVAALAAAQRSRRIWLIENRQESLRRYIEAARRSHKPRSHYQAEMKRLTTERLALEGVGAGQNR